MESSTKSLQTLISYQLTSIRIRNFFDWRKFIFIPLNYFSQKDSWSYPEHRISTLSTFVNGFIAFTSLVKVSSEVSRLFESKMMRKKFFYLSPKNLKTTASILLINCEARVWWVNSISCLEDYLNLYMNLSYLSFRLTFVWVKGSLLFTLLVWFDEIFESIFNDLELIQERDRKVYWAEKCFIFSLMIQLIKPKFIKACFFLWWT